PEGSNVEWLRDGEAIGAAANVPTYQLTTDDVCTRISVRVTPPSDSPAAPVTSEQTDRIGFPASAVQQPTVSGSAVVGKKLTAHPSDWPTGPRLSYQWLRNGSLITGATSSSYTLQTADQGKQINVRVTGEIIDCFTHQVTSTAVEGGKVLGAALAAATPTIKGTAKVGNTLTAQTG